MNIEAAKLKIIKTIAEIQSEALLKQLLVFIAGFKDKALLESEQEKEDPLAIARTPTPKSISLETLKKQQGYSIEKLNQTYAQLDRSIWEGEDIKELIQSI